MSQAALQGRGLARNIDQVHRLVGNGEVPSTDLRDLQGLRDAHLWWEQDGTLVATPRVVKLGDRLPVSMETVPAVFSLIPEVRQAWLRVLRARLGEMGDRQDVATLAEAVQTSGALAPELVKVEEASIAPTAYGELEREILPAAAHEAPAFPVLMRALAATVDLPKDISPWPLPALTFDDPSTSWRPGRLLRWPASNDTAPAQVVLSGALEGRNPVGDAMHWVLHHPWAYLLAQMVFTQEAWGAERISGGVAFELEPAHVPLFQTPPRVEVVVTLPSGEEIRCGSLGELVQHTLNQLQVTLLGHRVTPTNLDDRLGLVIQALQQRNVWRFQHGSGGRRPSYAIHPGFSDACYRTLGSRTFYRLGEPITLAIRRAAETWARERRARAGAGERP